MEEKEFNPKVCPYCGSENFEFMGPNDMYGERQWHCHECDSWFGKEDYEREDLRGKISALLMGYTEEKPLELDLCIGENRDENCGLSSLDLPWITSAFQDSEGRPWFNIDCFEEPIDIDSEELDLYDLNEIYKVISNGTILYSYI